MVNNICYVLGTSGPRFLFFVLRRLAIGIDFGIIFGLFGLPVFLDESLLIFPFIIRLRMPAPVRTPLYNLFAFVHPEVVSVLLQLPSQRLYWYNQFCYHIASFLFTLSIVSAFNAGPLATISRPSRTSLYHHHVLFQITMQRYCFFRTYAILCPPTRAICPPTCNSPEKIVYDIGYSIVLKG